MQFDNGTEKRLHMAIRWATLLLTAMDWRWADASQPPTAREIEATYRRLSKDILEAGSTWMTTGRLVVTNEGRADEPFLCFYVDVC